MFVVLLVTDAKFEFALLGPEHDRLAVHPAHHIKGCLGFAAQGQLQKIFLNAGLDGLAQFGLDLEEAVGGTKALDALVGAAMVVMFDPEFDAFTGRLEGIELGPDQKVLPEGGPEALNFAQGHWVLGPGLDVRHAVFFQFGLEAAGAAPGGVLAAVVGEHLLGWLILTSRHAIHFNHSLCCGTAEQVCPDDEP